MNEFTLFEFIKESNRIEGIRRRVRAHEQRAHMRVLNAPVVTVDVLRAFVAAVQPGAVLRDEKGLDVRVGRHAAPPGGPEIREALERLLAQVTRAPLIISPFDEDDAYRLHIAYEQLHPFTDGNGRSGRVLWLWMMGGLEGAPLGFLHHFYYQTLNESRNA